MAIRKTGRDAVPRPRKRSQSIWDRIEALGKEIPREELARFPADGARNLHHYLHGAPKQDPA
ncbi:MAG: hypothetical protein ACYC9X_07440 [Dehalococcoidia bacterium]